MRCTDVGKVTRRRFGIEKEQAPRVPTWKVAGPSNRECDRFLEATRALRLCANQGAPCWWETKIQIRGSDAQRRLTEPAG
jgi:hypothetical protein